MVTTTSTQPGSDSAVRSVLLVLLVFGLVVGSAVGLRSAALLVEHRSQRAAQVALAPPGRTDLALGEPVRTTFGALTATDATINNGLSPEELGGMAHGVSALVAQGRAQVEVTVTLANTGSRSFVVGAGQFALLTRKGLARPTTLRPSGTTLLAGPLPGRSSVDTRVSFVVPTDGSSMWLLYTDPGLRTPIKIALGRTNRISPATGHVH